MPALTYTGSQVDRFIEAQAKIGPDPNFDHPY